MCLLFIFIKNKRIFLLSFQRHTRSNKYAGFHDLLIYPWQCVRGAHILARLGTVFIAHTQSKFTFIMFICVYTLKGCHANNTTTNNWINGNISFENLKKKCISSDLQRHFFAELFKHVCIKTRQHEYSQGIVVGNQQKADWELLIPAAACQTKAQPAAARQKNLPVLWSN